MKAATPKELTKLVDQKPEEFASAFLADDSFAFYCYSNHSYEDLKQLFEKAEPNQGQCQEWGLSADEWLAGVEMALLSHYYEMFG